MNIIAEYDTGNRSNVWAIGTRTATYLPGQAEIPGSNPSTGSYRYHLLDRLGSIRALRDQNKTSLASYEYTPYGEIQG